MSNETKTPNGASRRELEVVTTEEEVCPNIRVCVATFNINDEKNRVETSRRESKIADINDLKFEDYQTVTLKGNISKPKTSKNTKTKKVSSKEKKLDEEELEDTDKTKKARKVATSTPSKHTTIKKSSTEDHTDVR